MPLIPLLATLAWAEDPPPEASSFVLLLDAARADLLQKDWAGARTALAQAQAVAPANDVLVLGADLGRLDFYRGVIEWRVGDRDKGALDAWRRAAVLAPDFQPDKELLPDTEEQDAFYAVVSEVKGYEQVELALPDDPGGATIFIDGQPRDVGDFLVVGTHYVQIRCDDGSLAGSWYTLGPPPPDWLVLCSGGTYPVKGKAPKKPKDTPIKVDKDAVAAADKAAADKAAADKAAADKAAADKAAADKAAADKAAADKAAADKAAAVAKAAADKAAAEAARTATSTPPPVTTTTPVATTPVLTATDTPPALPPEVREPRDHKGFGGVAWTMVATGGALLVGGAAYERFVFEPLYADGQTALGAPESITADDATSLEKRYNAARFASLGLLGGGALVVGSGVIVGAVDAHLYVGPGRLGLVGRW